MRSVISCSVEGALNRGIFKKSIAYTVRHYRYTYSWLLPLPVIQFIALALIFTLNIYVSCIFRNLVLDMRDFVSRMSDLVMVALGAYMLGIITSPSSQVKDESDLVGSSSVFSNVLATLVMVMTAALQSLSTVAPFLNVYKRETSQGTPCITHS